MSLESLHSEEILETTLAGLEPLTSEFDPKKIHANPSKEQIHLLHELKFNKQAIKVLNAALQTENSKGSRSDLLTELNQLVKILKDNSPSTDEINPQEALIYAEERSKRRNQEKKYLSKPLIRTIHHLACTGGTLISKCLGSMPDVALISEVNPLNRQGSQFEPTNPFNLFERRHDSLARKM